MAISAMTNVFETSPAKGNARLVELVLANAISDKKLKAGYPPLAWISQSTIACLCNCSSNTVERALVELKKLGRIVDTGDRAGGKYRGTVIYKLPQDLLDGDHPQNRGPQNGGAVFTATGDLPHSGNDYPHSDGDHPQNGAPPPPECPPKPVVNPEGKPGDKDARTEARGSGLSPSSSGLTQRPPAQVDAERREDERELAILEGQLQTTPHSDATARCIADIRERLGLETAQVAA